MVSKNGVCYDLRESPYTLEWRGITYHFSSESHRRKYMLNVRERELWLNDSLSRRFRITVDLPYVADVQYYAMIETRGFYIITNDGAEYTAPHQVYVTEDIGLVGVVDDVKI